MTYSLYIKPWFKPEKNNTMWSFGNHWAFSDLNLLENWIRISFSTTNRMKWNQSIQCNTNSSQDPSVILRMEKSKPNHMVSLLWNQYITGICLAARQPSSLFYSPTRYRLCFPNQNWNTQIRFGMWAENTSFWILCNELVSNYPRSNCFSRSWIWIKRKRCEIKSKEFIFNRNFLNND